MFEYLKRRFARSSGNIIIDEYPQYYEKDGVLIQVQADGRRFAVKFGADKKIHIIRELTNE